MKNPFACPNCGQTLPLEDLNISTNLGLCRACGYSGPFLESLMIPKMTDEEMVRPPKRVSLRREFGDALTIECRPSRVPLLFLVPFTVLWSGVSMAGIYGSQIWKGQFDPKLSLFGLPFLLGTILLTMFILYGLFGKTTITLSKGKARVATKLFGAGRVRELECGKDTTVVLAKSNYRVNNVAQPEIVLASKGRELKFGAAMLTDEAKKYVAAVLRRAAGGG